MNSKDISQSFISIYDDYEKKEKTDDTDLLKEILSSQISLSNQCNVIAESQLLILKRMEILSKDIENMNNRFQKIEDEISETKTMITAVNNRISKNDTAEMYSQIRKYNTKQRTTNPLGFVKLDNNLLKM